MTLAVLLLLFQVNSQVEPYTFREDQGQTTKVTLQNGLTVIIRDQEAVPLASVTTFVKAGYFDENDRISGISHVIEHMFFKGTSKRAVGEIARETKALGGYLNAYTYYDRTVYHTVVPAENVKQALEIQSDALFHSTFDAAELKREIEVVLQENNRKLDNPSAVASEKLYATAFEQHRMRRWRIGTPEGLRALTRDDIVAYYTNHYQPSNIILTIVGRVDVEEMIAEVVKLYGDVTDLQAEPDPGPAEPAQSIIRYGSQRGPIEQTHVALGFHGPAILSNDARALEVLASILGDGRASILNQYVRDEKGLITSGSASHHAFRDVGYFEIDFETTKPVEAQIAVLAELENIKKSGVTNEAVGRAKALIAQAHYHNIETVQGVADDLGFYEALGDWKKSDEYIVAVQKVTAADVLRVAKQYLNTDQLSVFEYLPMSETRTSNADDYRQLVLAKVQAATEDRSVNEFPVTAAIPSDTDGVLHDLVKPMQKRSILRGPDVYILEDHRLPLVSFGIFYPGGRLYESEKNVGITELMLRTAIRGTKRFNSADISRRLENAGARLQIVNEPDFFGYILDGISGKMDQALEVLMDVLQQPSFQQDDIDREKMLQSARIKQLRENTYSYPVSIFMRTLFGDHAYARTAIGTDTSLQSITHDDLDAWFKTNQRPLIPLIIIDGDTNGTALVAPIADALTNEDLHARDITSLPSPTTNKETKETVESVPRQQTALVYGFPGVRRSAPDRYTLTVLENVVSGLGGRFFEAIREKQGLAYTVRMANAAYSRSGAIFTYTAFSPENEMKVREALEMEFDKLRTEGITEEEVKKAIAYSVGEHAIALQTRVSTVLEYARAIYVGGGIQDVQTYDASIRKVTTEQLRVASRVFFDPANLRVAVVRGTKQ
jgi:zinc protease